MKHQFNGYYDLCPWSPDNKHFLKMEADFYDREPREGEKLRILVDDKVVAETSTWNWQMGCRARWGMDDNEVIFYDEGGKYLVKLDTRKRFLWESGYVETIINDYHTLPEGYGFKPHKYKEGDIVLLYKYGAKLRRKPSGFQELITRSGKPNAHVSHFNERDGQDNVEYICFGKLFNPPRKYIPKFALNFIRNLRGKSKQLLAQQGYFLWNSVTDEITKIGWGKLTEDGHPSFHPTNNDLFVSDTYVHKGFRTLFTYNIKTGEYTELYKHPSQGDIEDSPMRADMHPKWDREGKQIAIDIIENGQRKVKVIVV